LEASAALVLARAVTGLPVIRPLTNLAYDRIAGL
jgi:hypothetical protein